MQLTCDLMIRGIAYRIELPIYKTCLSPPRTGYDEFFQDCFFDQYLSFRLLNDKNSLRTKETLQTTIQDEDVTAQFARILPWASTPTMSENNYIVRV